MSRRKDRVHAFRLIYQLEFFKDFDAENRIDVYFEETADADTNNDSEPARESADIDKEFVRRLVIGVVANKKAIDDTINQHISGWSLERLNKAELAVLRLALFELWNADDYGISWRIVINEAVNLAKTCSQDGTGSFVNGVLGSIVEKSNIEKSNIEKSDVGKSSDEVSSVTKSRVAKSSVTKSDVEKPSVTKPSIEKSSAEAPDDPKSVFEESGKANIVRVNNSETQNMEGTPT